MTSLVILVSYLLVCLSESVCSVQWDKSVWLGRWV